MIKPYAIVLISALAFAGACSDDSRERITTFPNKFADQELVKLYDFKDRRQSEALIPYLTHEESVYREEAALAFASIQDTLGLPYLYAMLSDPAVHVRKSAAFAIGQMKMKSSQSSLANRLPLENEAVVVQYLLEALGKCLSVDYVHFLAGYEARHPLAITGKAWGIYRAGVSGLSDSVLTNAAGELLADSLPDQARLAAAHYFSRLRGISIDKFETELTKLTANDALAEIRMAAARALSKSDNDSIAYFLNERLQLENDARVKVNLLRALKPQHLTVVEGMLASILKGSDYQLSVTAAEVMSSWDEPDAGRWLWGISGEIPSARTRAVVLASLLTNYQYAYNAYRALSDLYGGLNDPYDKGFVLKALGNYPNASALLAEGLEHPHPFVRTSAMEGLSAMNQLPGFPAYKQAELAGYYKKAILSGDAGQVTVAASTLFTLKDKLQPYLGGVGFMRQGLDSLHLPDDLEPFQALERTINLYEGRKTDLPALLYQNPILWEVVKEIRKGSGAIIETSRGSIEMELLIEEAPGSVENFVSLARAGFYTNLAFHRVVPNFVIQAGCPRGDGYGSSDGVIRSEFTTLQYGTGYVGMASAGKDTEGSQWFITHSPAPHLDGAYTIFGKVTSGMDVVNAIEAGDRIISIVIL